MHHLLAIAQSDFAKGKEAFMQRYDGAVGLRAKPEPIVRAIHYLRLAYATGKPDPDAGVLLARALIFKGRFVDTDPKQKSKSLEEAKGIGEQLIAKHPLNPECRFEHLAALGLWGESLGVFRAAKEGIATRMKEACEAMIRMDPEFMNGVGKRSLGVLNYKVPRIPLILNWPDKKQSLTLIKEVYDRYPNDVANTFYHAEILMEHGRHHEAEPYLHKVLGFAPDPDKLLEHRTFHLEAQRLLKQLSTK